MQNSFLNRKMYQKKFLTFNFLQEVLSKSLSSRASKLQSTKSNKKLKIMVSVLVLRLIYTKVKLIKQLTFQSFFYQKIFACGIQFKTYKKPYPEKQISLPLWPSVTQFLNLYHCKDILHYRILQRQRVWMTWYVRDLYYRLCTEGSLVQAVSTIIGPRFQMRRAACGLKETGHQPKVSW